MKIKQKRKDGLKRQEQIMSISLELFSVKGFHATSVDEIIAAAGIAKGTFYLHFTNKNDILDMIIESKFSMIFEFVKVLDISQSRSYDEIKKLYVDVAGLIINVQEFKQFTKLLLRDIISLDQIFLNKINNFYNGIVSMSEDYIRKAQNDGRARLNLDPKIVSISIVGSIKEILFRWVVMEEEIDVEKTISTILDLYLKGLMVAEKI